MGNLMTISIKKNALKSYKFLIFLLFLTTLIGCADVRLVPNKTEIPSILSEDSFCVVEPAKERSGAKIMFVVDISFSNSRNDPSGSKRVRNINQFVEEEGLKEYLANQYYGLVIFDHEARSILNYDEDASKPKFTKDLDEIKDATQTLARNPFNPVGNTNYTSALDVVHRAIQVDIEKFPHDRYEYIIFFLSDGIPNRNVDSIDLRIEQIIKDVKSAGRKMSLSTAFYGTEGEAAIKRLQEMSELGGGAFVNFETDDIWDLNKLWPAEMIIPWNLKEFLVYNLNAGFCLDGKIDVDSDMDGMCDRDEITMNTIYAEQLKAEGKLFDPANRFSFGDGYGDAFHWLRFRYPGKTLYPCEGPEGRSDEDFDLLTHCEEKELLHRTAIDDDPTTGNPKVFDTDRDGLLDGIETFVYFASKNTGRTTRYTAALDNSNIRDDIDGEGSVLTQIKEHRNPWFPDDPDTVVAYDTLLNPLNTPTLDCYTFQQDNLPVYKTLEVKAGNTLPGLEHAAGENSIMVYYIQVLEPEPDSVGVLKHSVQKVKWGSTSTGLQVKEGTFNTYEPPKGKKSSGSK